MHSGRWSLRAFFACLILVWVVPITYTLRFYLPYNASVLSRSTPSFLLLVPEGWGVLGYRAFGTDLANGHGAK